MAPGIDRIAPGTYSGLSKSDLLQLLILSYLETLLADTRQTHSKATPSGKPPVASDISSRSSTSLSWRRPTGYRSPYCARASLKVNGWPLWSVRLTHRKTSISDLKTP